MADVIVTERCDQTIVEVYTCPPAGGGGGSGAFYTGVNLGTGAQVYVTTDNDADPREHHFRTLVGVGGTTVEAVGNEIQIGGGGSYTGVNIGGGGEVYKETDDTTSPREHRYRTIIGNNILVEQDDVNVVLSAMASAAGGGPPGIALGKLNGGCGTTSTITPSSLAGLAVGDLILWVVVCGRTSTNQVPMVLDPTGWSVLARRSNIANEYHQSHFYYKWADGLDVAGASHAVSINAGSGSATVCSTAFVYKNAHRNLPFGGCARIPGGRWAPGEPPHCPTFSSAQSIMQMWQYRGAASGIGATWPWVDRFGPPVDLENFHAIFDSFNVIWMNWHIASRLASTFEDENWIPGESLSSSMGGAGWTALNMIASGASGQWALLRGSGVLARHYWEFPVTLEAGVKYQFAYMNQGSWVASQPNDWTTLSYEDPSGNERGFQNAQGQTGNSVLDPLVDIGTVWFNRSLNAGRSGVPSTTGSVCRICFTAQESGIHKLRIGIGAGSGATPAWTYTGSGSENRNVTGVVFRKGWENYRRVRTATGAVYGGATYGASAGQGWLDAPHSGTGQLYTAVAINPDWDQLPRAHMASCAWHEGDVNCAIEDDKFTIYNAYTPGDDQSQAAVATRPIMPRINEVLQKYYLEFTVLTATNEQVVGVVSVPAMRGLGGTDQIGYYWEIEGGYCRDLAGTAYGLNVGVPTTCPAGTVIGVTVDYLNAAVKFYRNNVLACTVPMPNTYPTDNFSPEWPLWAYIRAGNTSGSPTLARMRANLAGTFAYPQTGFLAYDWAGATTTESVDDIESVGDGISLVGGSATSPTIKSLVEGRNVVITDDGDTVTINADVPVPIIRGAAWSDASAIDVLEARPVSVVCPHAGTIKNFTVLADTVGSAQVSVFISSYANFPSLTLICGTNKPKLISAQKAQDAVLTDWTIAVAAGDILTFTLDSCTGLKWLAVQVEIEEVI